MLDVNAKQPSVKQENATSWCRNQMETFSALLAICAGNSPVTGEFPAQRPVTRSCDVFSDLRLNKRFNNIEAVDLRHHPVRYDVIVMSGAHSNIMDPFEICVKLKSRQIPFAQFRSTDSPHMPHITEQYICIALYMISDGYLVQKIVKDKRYCNLTRNVIIRYWVDAFYSFI